MGTYAVGDATKESIKNTARTLFYEQGVSSVSDAIICREAGVQRGLVGYHFGSRGGLVAAIYHEYVEALREAVERRFPTDDPALAYCILEYLLVDCLHRNERLRRFYVDIIAYPEVSDDEVRVQHEQLSKILARKTGSCDITKLKIAVTLSQGAFNEMIRCIESGYLDGELDELLAVDLRMSMSLVDVHDAEAENLLRKTIEMTEGYRLAVGKTLRPRIMKANPTL